MNIEGGVLYIEGVGVNDVSITVKLWHKYQRAPWQPRTPQQKYELANNSVTALRTVRCDLLPDFPNPHNTISTEHTPRTS